MQASCKLAESANHGLMPITVRGRVAAANSREQPPKCRILPGLLDPVWPPIMNFLYLLLPWVLFAMPMLAACLLGILDCGLFC